MDTIFAELKLNAKGFFDEIVKVKAGLSDAESATTGRLGIIAQAAKKSFSEMGQSSGLMGSAMKAGSALGIDSTAVMGAAITGGLAAAGGAIAKFAQSGLEHYAELADQTRTVMATMGGTAEQASALVAEANTLGVSTDSLARAMGLFGKAIETTPEKLRTYGVEVVKNAQGQTDMNATLESAITAFQGHTDAAERDAMGAALFGRSWREVAPLLKATADERQRITDAAKTRGEIMSQGDLDHVRSMHIAMREAGESFKSIGTEIGKDVAPFVAIFAQGLANVAHWAQQGVHYLTDLLKPVGWLIDHIPFIGSNIQAITSDTNDGTQANADYAGSADDVSDAQGKQLNTADDLIGVIESAANAEKSFTRSKQELAKAQREEKDAQDTLTKLMAKGAVDAKQVAEAEDKLAAANDRVTAAIVDQTDAQHKLDDLLRPQDPDAIAAAQDKQAAAADKVTRSNEALVDAQQKLNDLLRPELSEKYAEALGKLHEAQSKLLVSQASGDQSQLAAALQGVATAQDDVNDALKPATQQEIADAQLDVNDATRAVHQAQRDVTQSAKDLEAEQRPSIGTAEEISGARQTLADKTKAVDAAQKDVTQSQKDLTQVQAGDPDFQTKVREAREHVADATQSVADAQNNVTTSGIAFHESIDTMNADIAANPGLVQAAIDKLNQWAADDPDVKSPLLQMMLGKIQPKPIPINITVNEPANLLPFFTPPPTAPDADAYNKYLVGVPKNADPIPYDDWTKMYGAGHHAAGGRMAAGELSWVGERGPELWLPDRDGTVVPNNALGSSVSVGSIVIYAAADPEGTARAVRSEMLRLARNNVNVGLR